MEKHFLSAQAADTAELGRRIGERIPAGTVIALSGDLGAGKTVFAAGVAAGLGISDTVTSPTYIFYNEYSGREQLCHIDAYRLEGLEDEEKSLIGLDDALAPHKVVLVEWPQFIADWLPADSIRLHISRISENERKLSFCYDAERQAWLDEAIEHR